MMQTILIHDVTKVKIEKSGQLHTDSGRPFIRRNITIETTQGKIEIILFEDDQSPNGLDIML